VEEVRRENDGSDHKLDFSHKPPVDLHEHGVSNTEEHLGLLFIVRK